MESFIRPPDALKNNKPATWAIWKEEFLIFMNLIGYTQRSQSYKANLFKNLIGTVGLETINKLPFNDTDDKENLDVLLQKLDNHYNPQETEAQIRYKFFNSSMKSDETIENYIQNLKEKAKGCNFGNITDSLIRDVIILNTHDKILRQKYLQEDNLNYDKITAIYKNHQIQESRNKTKLNLNEKKKNKELSAAVSKKEKNNPKECGSGNKQSSSTSIQGSCWKCHTKHPKNQCPAFNHKCTKCNVLHHFERCCKAPLQNTVRNLQMNNLSINHEKHVSDNKMYYNVDKNF